MLDLSGRIIDPSLQISAVTEPTDVIDHSDRLVSMSDPFPLSPYKGPSLPLPSISIIQFDTVYRNENSDSKPNLLFYDDSSFIGLANGTEKIRN